MGWLVFYLVDFMRQSPVFTCIYYGVVSILFSSLYWDNHQSFFSEVHPDGRSKARFVFFVYVLVQKAGFAHRRVTCIGETKHEWETYAHLHWYTFEKGHKPTGIDACLRKVISPLALVFMCPLALIHIWESSYAHWHWYMFEKVHVPTSIE